MYKFLLGVFVTIGLAIVFWFFFNKKEEKEQLAYNSALIQQQIQQVGKLIVTEGYFSQVTSYRNTRKNYLDLFTSSKKALVVVNAKVTVSYDLRMVKTEIDEQNKTVIITAIPKEEVQIYPDIEYYDVTQDYFNKFGAEDYNKIKSTVHKMIREKVDQSDLLSDAKSRLISELGKIYILTNSMGWILQYNEITIDSPEGLESLTF